MSNKKTIIMLILRAICLIIFPLSYVFDPKYSGEITFFTVQSNILVLLVMIILSIFDILKLSGKFIEIPTFVKRLQLVSTTSISLTFIVFGIILTPVLIIDDLQRVVLSYSSIVMHQIIPIVALLDWILDEPDDKISFGYTPIALCFPLYYFIFTLVVSHLGVTYPTYENGVKIEGKFPYFFLDYETNGWFEITPAESFNDYKIGVFYWLVLILIILSIMSFLLILLKNLQFYFKCKKQLAK